MRRHADWFRQAERRLASARWDIEGGFHENACFSAQQAAELAAEAWLEGQGRVEIGHAVLYLLARAGQLPPDIEQAARTLDRYHIPTRYPDGFSQGAPMDYYDAQTAEEAVRFAEVILEYVAEKLEGL